MEIISLKDVCKSYMINKNKSIVLERVNIKIFQGDFIIILGSSGSGKSTLMNIIAGLDVPTSGEIYFRGKKISHMNDFERSSYRNINIGFIFQQFNLIDTLNVMENIKLPLLYNKKINKNTEKENISKIESLLNCFGIMSKIKSKPNILSGGEQQRVSICRALINNPDIILADEPTGALDRHNTNNIMQILKRINSEGKTIIMATHDTSLLKYSNRVFRICDGKLTER